MKPEGSKYNASLKWNIPCVSKEWMIESLNAGQRLPEEKFSLDLNKSLDATVSRVENKPSKTPKANNVEASRKNEQLISFDMSKRGASIMEGFDLVTRPNISVDETQQGPLSKAAGLKTTSGVDETVAGAQSLNDISSGKFLEKDFSSFNTMISKEPNTTTTATSSDKENNNSFVIPANKFDSPQFALDKSRFSFDFGDALEGMPSPAPNSSQDLRRKSSRKSRGSLPIGIQFSEALQIAADRHVPEEERAAMDESFTRRVRLLNLLKSPHLKFILHSVYMAFISNNLQHSNL